MYRKCTRVSPHDRVERSAIFYHTNLAAMWWEDTSTYAPEAAVEPDVVLFCYVWAVLFSLCSLNCAVLPLAAVPGRQQ